MRGHARDICRTSSSVNDSGALIPMERWTRLVKTNDETWSWKVSAGACHDYSVGASRMRAEPWRDGDARASRCAMLPYADKAFESEVMKLIADE